MTRDHTKQADPVEPTELTTQDLAHVAGGLTFTFKLVAVKTVGWAHDDEAPSESPKASK